MRNSFGYWVCLSLIPIAVASLVILSCSDPETPVYQAEVIQEPESPSPAEKSSALPPTELEDSASPDPVPATPADVHRWMKKELTPTPTPPEKSAPTSPPPEPTPSSSAPPREPGGDGMIITENPFWEGTGNQYNPDPGAFTGKITPVELFNPPLPDDDDYMMSDYPTPSEKEPSITPFKLPKFNPNNPSGPQDPFGLPAHTEIVESRWQIPYQQRARYPDPETAETPFQDELPYLWHPYKQSILKGDVPILGEDVFLKITASAFGFYEFNRTPTPSGISASGANNSEFFGSGDTIILQQNFPVRIDLFSGETEVFKPVNWLLRIQPVFNINYFETKETGVLNPDVRGDTAINGPIATLFPGSPGQVLDFQRDNLDRVPEDYDDDVVTRRREFLALQEGFFEFKIADVSSTFDFISTRLGYQTFNSDFRGLIFFDTNLGYRIFGNAENNLWQYNFAFFDIREKDTNSLLNTFDDRDQDVFIANLFRQDFIWPGYNVNFSALANFDSGNRYSDDNDFPIRPAQIGQVDVNSNRDIHAYYVGFSGEGKFGRVNISHSFYQAFGSDEHSTIANQEVDINAQQAHVEVSYDRDWIRYKGTFFYASGDEDPEDGTAGGFDTILDNPNLIGGPFSYWTRQGLNLASTTVFLKQRGSLIPNLRSAKFEGQSNFVNPGIMIAGVGADIELTTENRLFLNCNYIRFAETAVLNQVLFDNKIDNEVGWDLSIGLISRPLLTDNLVIQAGLGIFVPTQGYEDIYGQNEAKVATYDQNDGRDYEDILYSAFIQLSLVY
jgi:hypothetical protein